FVSLNEDRVNRSQCDCELAGPGPQAGVPSLGEKRCSRLQLQGFILRTCEYEGLHGEREIMVADVFEFLTNLRLLVDIFNLCGLKISDIIIIKGPEEKKTMTVSEKEMQSL
ncbi:hypothetical protein STEG23_002512, partial [Scotinomys teguina]